MKMRKNIIILICTILLFLIYSPNIFAAPLAEISHELSFTVSPPRLPYPFGQEVLLEGEPAINFEISIKNINTSDEIKTNTDEKGRYLVNLANFPNGYDMGNLINITLCDSESVCRSFYYPIEQEGGMISKLNIIDWDIKKYETLEDNNLTIELLQKVIEKQTEDFKIIFEEYKNETDIKADERIRTERIISIGIASIFVIFSFFVTRHYAIKYGNKKISRKKRKSKSSQKP